MPINDFEAKTLLYYAMDIINNSKTIEEAREKLAQALKEKK